MRRPAADHRPDGGERGRVAPRPGARPSAGPSGRGLGRRAAGRPALGRARRSADSEPLAASADAVAVSSPAAAVFRVVRRLGAAAAPALVGRGGCRLRRRPALRAPLRGRVTGLVDVARPPPSRSPCESVRRFGAGFAGASPVTGRRLRHSRRALGAARARRGVRRWSRQLADRPGPEASPRARAGPRSTARPSRPVVRASRGRSIPVVVATAAALTWPVPRPAPVLRPLTSG